jgi:hypothetical protein
MPTCTSAFTSAYACLFAQMCRSVCHLSTLHWCIAHAMQRSSLRGAREPKRVSVCGGRWLAVCEGEQLACCLDALLLCSEVSQQCVVTQRVVVCGDCLLAAAMAVCKTESNLHAASARCCGAVLDVESGSVCCMHMACCRSYILRVHILRVHIRREAFAVRLSSPFYKALRIIPQSTKTYGRDEADGCYAAGHSRWHSSCHVSTQACLGESAAWWAGGCLLGVCCRSC